MGGDDVLGEHAAERAVERDGLGGGSTARISSRGDELAGIGTSQELGHAPEVTDVRSRW